MLGDAPPVHGTWRCWETLLPFMKPGGWAGPILRFMMPWKLFRNFLRVSWNLTECPRTCIPFMKLLKKFRNVPLVYGPLKVLERPSRLWSSKKSFRTSLPFTVPQKTSWNVPPVYGSLDVLERPSSSQSPRRIFGTSLMFIVPKRFWNVPPVHSPFHCPPEEVFEHPSSSRSLRNGSGVSLLFCPPPPQKSWNVPPFTVLQKKSWNVPPIQDTLEYVPQRLVRPRQPMRRFWNVPPPPPPFTRPWRMIWIVPRLHDTLEDLLVYFPVF